MELSTPNVTSPESPQSALKLLKQDRGIAARKKMRGRADCAPIRKSSGSPARLTGCLSKLSALEMHEHAYFDALRDYAKLYAAASAYLGETDVTVEHDYTAASDSIRDLDHALLGDDGEFVDYAQVSDEEIDLCGYMGWLRH